MKVTEPITAKKIEATRDGLVLLLDNRRVLVPWKECSPKLAGATDEERSIAELSPGGYGIHWPMLDEDLSVGGLLRNL